VVNFTTVAYRISSQLKWLIANVIVKNKMSRFLWFSVYMSFRACWKSKTGRHNQDWSRRATNHRCIL